MTSGMLEQTGNLPCLLRMRPLEPATKIEPGTSEIQWEWTLRTYACTVSDKFHIANCLHYSVNKDRNEKNVLGAVPLQVVVHLYRHPEC